MDLSTGNLHLLADSEEDVIQYKVVPSWSKWLLELFDFENIFPITKCVGVNFQSPVFTIDKNNLQTFCTRYGSLESSDISFHSSFLKWNKVDHLGPTFTLLATKDDEYGEKVILLSYLCDCYACIRKVKSRNRKPVTKNVEFTYKNVKISTEMTFYPGVTENFDMAKRDVEESTEKQNIIYFSGFFKVDNGAFSFLPFQDPWSGPNVASYPEPQSSLDDDQWIPPTIDGHLEPDMELVSSDGKRFPCHKLVLTAHSQVLAELVAKDVKVDVPEESAVVMTFLKYLYFQNINNLKPLDCLYWKVPTGVLHLACRFQLVHIVGGISRTLKTKLHCLASTDKPSARRVLACLEKGKKYQIVFKLCQLLVHCLKPWHEGTDNLSSDSEADDENENNFYWIPEPLPSYAT